jgi:hypothetical protein
MAVIDFRLDAEAYQDAYRKLLLKRLKLELDDVKRVKSGYSVAASIGAMTAHYAQLIGVELPATVSNG